MTIYNWIVTVCWLTFLVVWLVSAARAKRTIERRDRGFGWMLRVIGIVAILVALGGGLLPKETLISPAIAYPMLGALGSMLCAVGVAFAIWARVYLGRNWGMPTSVKEDTELVTTGPYAYVRHPIYSGMILAMLGSSLVIGLVWAVIFLTSIIYFLYSAPVEEKLMSEQFPQEYSAYKARTKMLVPFLF